MKYTKPLQGFAALHTRRTDEIRKPDLRHALEKCQRAERIERKCRDRRRGEM